MPIFVIEPHRGVEPVRLGMARADVHRVMPSDRIAFRKAPDSPHDTDAWYASGFQVFYNGRELAVEYIELSSDPSYRVAYKEMDVFGIPADELVDRIAAGAPLGEWDGYSCVFPALEMALWRPTRDEPHFATIGIGVRGYFTDGSAEAH